MDSESARRAAELWHLIAGEPRRLAFLLTGNAGAAETIARRLYWRCAIAFRDRRDQYQLEDWLRYAVVRACARRSRATELGGFRRRRNRSPEPIDGLTHHQVLLWNSLHDLGFRVRAAAVLIGCAGLTRDAAADALGASAGGIDALWTKAHAALGAADAPIGTPDPIDDLKAAYEKVGDISARSAPNQEMLTARLRSARVIGVVLLTLVTAAACVGAVYAAGRINRGVPPPAKEAPSTNRPGELPASIEGLDYKGAPNWCPYLGGSLPFRRSDELEATGLTFRTNLALKMRYGRSLAYLLDRPFGAPDPIRWPTTAQSSGLRIQDSGPGTGNEALIERCGEFTARRSWIVVLEDPGPPYGDGVAFYLLRRSDDLKVWGTSSGTRS